MPSAHLLRPRNPGAAPARARPRGIRLWLERLQDRVMPSAGDSIANAIALSFPNTAAPYQPVQVTAENLAHPDDVLLNRVSLNAGDKVTASVNTAPYGGGLNSYL